MFITNISLILTFGPSYSKVTNNAIGAIETILATCWAGCAFTLFDGMPTVIVGSTGNRSLPLWTLLAVLW